MKRNQWTIGQRVKYVGFPVETLGTVVNVNQRERTFLVLWEGRQEPACFRFESPQYDRQGRNLGTVAPCED